MSEIIGLLNELLFVYDVDPNLTIAYWLSALLAILITLLCQQRIRIIEKFRQAKSRRKALIITGFVVLSILAYLPLNIIQEWKIIQYPEDQRCVDPQNEFIFIPMVLTGEVSEIIQNRRVVDRMSCTEVVNLLQSDHFHSTWLLTLTCQLVFGTISLFLIVCAILVTANEALSLRKKSPPGIS